MDTGVCILDIILQQQTSRIDIQVFGQGVRQHIDLQERNQLCGAATPGFLYQLCDCFQHRVRRLFIQLVFHAFQVPDLG